MNDVLWCIAMEQQRVSTRTRVRKMGRIILPGTKTVRECIILDVSETGALILHKGMIPPKTFLLYFKAWHRLYEAEIVREEQTTIGVRFTKSVDASGPEAAQMTKVNLSRLA